MNTLRLQSPIFLLVLSTLCLSSGAHAQPCLRWVERTDVGSPGERRHHKMAYDSDRGVVVLFGGAAGDDYLQGTQEYDGTRWRQIVFAGMQPPHRAYHAMAYDPVSHKVVMYGGFAGGLYGLDDTWTYQGDSVNGTWTHAFGNAANLGLAGSALVYDTARRQIIRYGGVTTPFEDPGGLEVPFFDTKTYEWRASTWVDSLAANGPGLYGFGMAFDQRRNVAVIAGGFGTIDEEDRTDHVWEYTDRVSWADRGPTLPGRGYPAMAYDSKRGRIVMVGGDGGQGNTAIEYDPARGWVRLPDFPHFGRAGAAMVYDSRREKMVFMGGAGAGETFSDTWELETVPLTFNIIAPPTNQLICLSNSVSIYSQPSDSRPLSQQWFVGGYPLEGQTNSTLNFSAIPFFGDLPFWLEATDLCGNRFTSAVAVVTIHRPPNIVSFDSSTQYLCPGEPFIVPVTAMSTLQPVTYQWFFNDTAIDLATHPTLSLQTLAHENTGFYRVRIRNDCGDTFSERKYLQVGVTIPRQPTNTTVDVCKIAGFSVGARGVGTLRYQWRLDGTPLANNEYFSGVTASNLTVRPCLYAYEGSYDVVVTDDCGSIHSVTSRVAKLTIKPGPEWVLRATNGPSARSEPAMAYDYERKVTLLFGGGQTTGGGPLTMLSDLWEWDGARWLQRGAHSSSNGWMYSVETGWRPSYSGQPVHRYQHSLTYDTIRRRFVLFGGQTRTPDQAAHQIFLNDTWEWDGTTWHFRATNGPAPRSRPSMAFDSRRGVTVMTGGFLNTADPTPGAVWEWDGVSWQMRTPTNGPATNYSQDIGAMVYDSFHRKILFGPSVGEQYGWTFRSWDGTNWTTVFDDFVSQFFRQQYGDMAFDSYRRRAVWFGRQSGPSDSTGFFNGQNWEALTGSPATPTPRYNLSMAYDTNRHATVMFGGETASQVFNGETWELIAIDVPLVNEQPVSQYLTLGANVAFGVTARGPLGAPLTYQWFKNGQPLTDGGRISGTKANQLRVTSALASDVGEYRVQVTDECGTSTSLSAVLVQGGTPVVLLAVNAATPIPGGGNFLGLPQGPGFHGNNIAFFGVGGLGQQGIYIADRFQPTSSPIKIADLNTAIPNGTGTFLSFFNGAFTPTDPCVDGSNVAFYGTGSGGQQGIYAWINNALIRVADTATAIPGGTGNFTATPTDPCISGDAVVFVGNGSGGQEGVYVYRSGTIAVVADTHTAIPGGTGNFTAAPTEPCISGDAIAFVGNGSGGQQGVYLSLAGTLSVVADTHTAIPGGFGNFTSIPTDPCINGDRVAFVGNGSGGQQGVYVKMPGDPCLPVADRQTPIPDGAGNFTGFGTVSISETDLVFLGHGVGGQTGIYDFVDDQLVKVVAVGDSIAGKRITGLDFSRNGLWGDPIAFQATFDDGSEGIYTMDIIVPSVLRITSLERVGAGLRFRFKSVVGRNYIIQSCADPAAGNWADLPGPAIPGTGSMLQATVTPAPGEPRQFYRMKQLP